MNPWLGILAVLGVLAVLMGALRAVRGRLPPELSRKTVHLGMGCVCLTFPWIFQEGWPVVVLALLAIAGLAAVRLLPALKREIGPVMGGVERASLGEFYFPAAVAAVFLLAGDRTLLYVIPVLTLTLADTVGALIGVRYGFARYRTDEGLKSAEGSVAFFTAAFLSCHVPLLLFSDTGRAETLLISLTAGFIVMLLEAIAWRGQDNLIIPLGMYFLLSFYLPLDAAALTLRFLVILGLVALVLIGRQRTTLSDSAILAGALSGYAVWAFGGWLWLAPPLLLFLVYLSLPSFPREARPVQNLHAVTRVMAGAFLWLLAARLLHSDALFLPYLLCLAAHTGNIISARLRVVRGAWGVWRILLLAWAAASLLFGALAALTLPGWTALLVPLAVAASLALFFPAWPVTHTPENRPRVWLSETGVAILVSLGGLLFL